MIIDGRDYVVVMGSDLERDGLFLELYLGTDRGRPMAECFYSDRDGSLTLTEYVPGVPDAALTWLHSEGTRRLPPTIEVSAHRDDIKRTLNEVGLPECSLEIVDSVLEWAKSVGVEEKNHERLAMALLADGNPLIVFKSEITENDRSGVIGRLMFGGFDAELRRIQLPESFLEHLVLHEAAHLLLPGNASEEECDRWAFDHLASRISRRIA
jgi:hypothetical protein